MFGLDFVQYNFTVPPAVTTTTSATSTSVSTSTSGTSTTGLIMAPMTSAKTEQSADEAVASLDPVIPGPEPSADAASEASPESAKSSASHHG